MGVPLVDSIICGKDGEFYSFAEKGHIAAFRALIDMERIDRKRKEQER